MKNYFVMVLMVFAFQLNAQKKKVSEGEEIVLNLQNKKTFLVIHNRSYSDLNTGEELTLEANIKLSSTKDYVAIVNKHWCLEGGGAYHFGVRDGKLTFVWTETGNCSDHAVVISKQVVIKPKRWYHVACTFDNGQVTLYVNGLKINCEQTGKIEYIHLTSAPVLVGTYRNLKGEYTSFLNGYIDNLRIWNVSRTTSEIEESKNTSIQNASKHLLVNLTFDKYKLKNEGSYPSSPDCEGESCGDQKSLFSIK